MRVKEKVYGFAYITKQPPNYNYNDRWKLVLDLLESDNRIPLLQDIKAIELEEMPGWVAHDIPDLPLSPEELDGYMILKGIIKFNEEIKEDVISS